MERRCTSAKYARAQNNQLLKRLSRIVCTSKIGNLSVQVGIPPEVGAGYGHSEVLGVGSAVA